MPKYYVYLPVHGYNIYLVDAEDKDEAEAKVQNGEAEEVDFDWNDNASETLVELIDG